MAEKSVGRFKCSKCGFNEVASPGDKCFICLGKEQLKAAGEFRINIDKKLYFPEQFLEVDRINP